MKEAGPLKPLTEEELDELDKFLLNRIPDEVAEDYDENRDEGILDVSELDGFLTAIVCGPNLIPPSRWIPAVWGDCEPVWDTIEEAERRITMMIRLMNVIAEDLIGGNLAPVFDEREVDGKTYIIVDEWCEGFMRGVFLDEGWLEMNDDAKDRLLPVMAFTHHTDWIAHEGLSEEGKENAREAIPSVVVWFYNYWRDKWAEYSPPAKASGTSHQKRPVGANDPCPCGSGLKYKKCCRGN